MKMEKLAVQLNTTVEEKSVKGNLDEGPQETMDEDSFVADRPDKCFIS